MGKRRQNGRSLPVEGPVFPQKAEDEPVAAVSKQQPGVFQRGSKLRRGIAESALPRPHHGHDLHPGFPLGYQQRAEGRRQAAVEQITVEFYPVGAGAIRLDDVVRAPAAHLYQRFLHISRMILSISSHFFSMSRTSLMCERARSRFCPG